jgi:hypothetical protein
LDSLADNRAAMAGSSFPLADHWPQPNEPAGLASSRLSSVLVPFSVYPTEPATVSEGSRPPGHPAATFCDAFLRFFSATPLRKRLTSFAPATVDRNQSCVTGLILGGVPLSAPYGFGLVDSVRLAFCK